MFTRAPSVEAGGLSKGVKQLEVTVLKVILHVIPVVHCGGNRDLSMKVPPNLLPPQPIPQLPSGQLLTSNATMGLLDVVEPQGRQVEHLTGLHRAAKGPGLTVTGVPGQIWSQWVQWDPGYLGT